MPPTFGHTALQAWVECVTAKEGDKIRLVTEACIVPVVVTQCLKPSDSANGIARAALDVIDIVKMQDPKIRVPTLIAFEQCDR